MTILYSVLHFLVDGICAFAMFRRFLPQGNAAIDLILYNFCAFALQMPFGVMLDMKMNSRTCSYLTAIAGVICTIIGTMTHPIILGIGNALFHIGGGVETIHEDDARGWKGRGLGVFVAPGALGLYLGTLAAKNGTDDTMLRFIYILMILLCAAAAAIQHKNTSRQLPCRAAQIDFDESIDQRKIYVSVCCLFVVILRSYTGMSVTFPWKTTIFSGTLAVLTVVIGKMAGGFLSARYGLLRTSVLSLSLAAIAYIGSSVMPIGIAALFLFNMTMPITLYLMICQFPQMPGFSFGLLTFGLFLGFLPEYFGLPLIADGHIIGSAGSILSLFILLIGIKNCRRRLY